MQAKNCGMKRAFKGIWIPRFLWELKELTWSEKLVLLEIDSLSALDLGCIASDQHFADFLGIKKGTASNIVSSLRKKGYIETVEFDGRKRQLKLTGSIHFKMNAALTQELGQDSLNNEHKKTDKKTDLNPHLFKNSEFFDFGKFEAEFLRLMEEPKCKYRGADIKHYYDIVESWSRSKGRRRIDWIAQTRNIMLSDKSKGKLVLNGKYKGASKKADTRGNKVLEQKQDWQ